MDSIDWRLKPVRIRRRQDGDTGNFQRRNWTSKNCRWLPTTLYGGSTLEWTFGVEIHHFTCIRQTHLSWLQKQTHKLGNYQEVQRNFQENRITRSFTCWCAQHPARCMLSSGVSWVWVAHKEGTLPSSSCWCRRLLPAAPRSGDSQPWAGLQWTGPAYGYCGSTLMGRTSWFDSWCLSDISARG